MNSKKLFNDIVPHAIAIVAFLLVGYVYYLKTFNGYSHSEQDVTQGHIKGTEIRKYTDKDGNFPGWTNAIFSGMPTVMLQGKVSGNEIKSFNYLTPVGKTSYPFQILIMCCIGFYMLMNAFNVKPLLGGLAALAYAFATYSISSVEAAHYTKVLAMGAMPALLASLHWLFNGRYLLGGVTLAFNMALQLYFFHYQITFYSIVCMLAMGIYYLIELSREGKVKQLLIATVISIIAVGGGVLSNISKIKSTSSFAESTMRGGNEMARADKNVKQKETAANGLDRDYAFAWSYDLGETFTLLIPDFYGGSSNEKLSKSSKFYEVTQDEESINGGLPMYHGSLTFTSGPIYIGAIIVFLFVLGCIIVRNPVKWPLIALTGISFILGWGRHFGIINNFLFEHLPYYNKFRVPMMAFSIAQVTMPLIGFLGLKELYDNWQSKGPKAPKQGQAKQVTKAVKPQAGLSEELWNKVLLSFYIVGGFCLLMAVFGPNIVDMGGAVDEQLRARNANMIPILKEDRASLLRKDSLRSLIYICIAFGFLLAWFKSNIKNVVAVSMIGLFAVVDLIGVDWRYLGWDAFVHEKAEVAEVIPDKVDKQIMDEYKRDIHFRVLDFTSDPFNDNSGAAFYRMIGGYDPAKLSRYQDVISQLLAPDATRDKALDMLNCKYMIGTDSFGRVLIPRPTANGNAWFVKELVSTPDAAAEMGKVKSMDNKVTATFNASYGRNKGMHQGSFMVDSAVSAKLVKYHPDTMRYEVSNDNDGYLVFSEIFYDNWKAEIDGKPADLNKVDYTLRGISVPKGRHHITLYFDKGKTTTDNIEKGVSIAILAGMLILIIMWLRSYFTRQPEQVTP